MIGPIRKVYDWAGQKATTRFSPLWLGLVFLMELVLVVPLDALLMLFCMQNPKKRFVYALVGTFASAVSGILGYMIGLFLWDTVGPFIVKHLISESFFNRLVSQYNTYQHWAVILGSFLPVPFKAVALSAGFCQIAVVPFIAFVVVARAARFFIIAQLMGVWGEKVKAFIDRHFGRVVVALGAKIALTVTFFWALGH